ncbi:MAG: fumarylacetoacetate hydrolase family protein [Chloroflexi bacterium]|nr:fumarylacetoacetate hydrolase family protein [Chloroflexota bacterium]
MTYEQIQQVLVEAEMNRVPVGPVSDLVEGGLSLEAAYTICENNMAKRYLAGEKLVGYKVGFTNIAVREKMGLPDSTYGYLTDRMVLVNGGEFNIRELIAPKLECEICFRLRRELGAGATIEQVLAATSAVVAAYEICDARIRDWKCPYPDFFADNGFSARIVLGDTWLPVSKLNLLQETVTLEQDQERIAEGKGVNALGHPAKAVAWLADKLAERGQSLHAGQLIMTGTLTPILPIRSGSQYTAFYSSLGILTKKFI